MIPKNSVIKESRLIPSPLLFFPAVNRLNNATRRIVMGIINSIRLLLHKVCQIQIVLGQVCVLV